MKGYNNQNIMSEGMRHAIINREINFNKEFTREYINEIIDIFNRIKRYDDIKKIPEEKRVITINIYTYGGQIYSLLALLDEMDIMRSYGYKFKTITKGFSASCGFVLSIYGDERYMTKNAYLLNHQGSTMAFGTFKDIEITHREMKRLEKRINDIIVSKTKFTEEELMRPYNENIDVYYDSDECLKWGIVDAII